MLKLEGLYIDDVSYTDKEGKKVEQAVVYSTGEGVSYRLTGVDKTKHKRGDMVSIPVRVMCFDNKISLRVIE